MSSAKKLVSGKVTKKVDCAGCGRSYEYAMSRTVMGSSSKNAVTQAEADAQALEDANAKLQAALVNDCDPVCCPSCGAFTKEMKTYRWKRFGAALACTGVGAGILLVVFLLMLLMHKILIIGALGGAVCVLLGLALFAIAAIDLMAPKKGRL
jgi:hypothetical protein